MYLNINRENFKSNNNQTVLQILIQEVKTLNENCDVEQIKGKAIPCIEYPQAG